MKNLQAYKNQIQKIEGLINKLEQGELSLDELLTIEKLTRELHERSIILKYKAFENHVNGEAAPSVEEKAIVEEKTVEDVSPEEPAEEEAPDIDFSIFESMDEVEEEPEVVPEPVVEAQPVDVEPEPEVEIQAVDVESEPKIEPAVVVAEPAPIEEPKVETSGSFWEKINSEDNSLGAQFAGAKLDSLVGAFGLNEKLRFINDLFDGSSEIFSDSIKILDAQSNLEDARVKVGEMASEHSWDPEEESVVEFITFVNRRYA